MVISSNVPGETDSPSQNQPGQNAHTIADGVVVTAIGRWKAKLIDVSKRNRGLNFRPTPVTTVRIVDEYPPQIFLQLYLLEGKMRFRAAPATEPKQVRAATGETTEPSGEELFDLSPSVDFVTFQNGELGQEYTDNFLQTNLPSEKLQNSLRRIADQAQASLEEQGVNTLFLALGTLHYKDADQSDEIYQAPLIFLPVQLSRTSASTPFTVTATDEDPFVNPALVEHLRNAHGLALPELPDREGLAETYDLQSFYTAVEASVRSASGWRVTSDIFLGFFSFQKYVMFKDLEKNTATFANHRLLKQVVHRTGTALHELPEDIRKAELDEQFPAESTAQVVDADSSQLRAIYAAGLGHDLVLVGPPGTGKSQTITNLIAQALSQDKTVLFVAEKRAALEVVYNRLVEAGLGEFCLELHSNKANKRDVMRGIAAAWDLSLTDPETIGAGAARLPKVREELSEYVDNVHTPFGALAFTPYRAFWELERVRNAPKLELTADVTNLTQQQLEEIFRDLADLAREAEPVGIPSEHPWRDTGQTLYLEAELDRLERLLAKVETHLSNVLGLVPKVEADYGLPTIRTLSDVASAAAVAEMFSRSPGAPLEVLSSDLWNSPPAGALNLIKSGKEVSSLRAGMEQRFTADVLIADHAPDIAYIEAKENSPLSFLNFLSGRFRAIKARWLSYRRPGYNATLLDQANDLRNVDRYRAEREKLASKDAEGRQYFGSLWRGEDSDWAALDNYVSWVVEFRNTCIQKSLKQTAISTAAKPHPDITPVTKLREEAEQARTGLEELIKLVLLPKDYFERTVLAEIKTRITEMLRELSRAQEWAKFEIARQKVVRTAAAEVLTPFMSGTLSGSDLVSAFRRAFFQNWIAHAVRSRPPLANFSSLRHEQRVEEFRRMDLQVLQENRQKLAGQLRRKLRSRVRDEESLREPLAFLRTQLTLQRGHRPLRITMERAFDAIRSIKPVFMMSPLSVAQFLRRDAIKPFDLVIFDEASQLPSEDSVGAIARGEQLIVVGDPNQLPPTNFFAVLNNGGQVPRDEHGDPIILDGASILEEFGASGPPSTTLRWHYRSAHESLITFSNASFYDYALFTFPSVNVNSHAAGLSFEFIPDGLYEGAGLNRAEARKVADAVVEHAKRNPDVSLGVGTFNLRQQIAISDELELRRKQDPSIEPFFDRNKREPFFIKNLENIQGDERDFIFLSVTYAKNADGELKHFFGPLNSENGWKRLNVLTTRARKGMRVFSSIKGDYIDPSRVTTSGPKYLRDFLIYAEHGRLDTAQLSESAKTESPFEEQVYQELTRRELKLKPQVGAAGYRIDFGVRDDEVHERFICGIECDGVAYHLSETARDRDRLRQQVLEARGWSIFRIWSTDWFKDREGQINRILKLVDGARQRAIEEACLEKEERETHAEEARPKDELSDSEDTPGTPGEVQGTSGDIQATQEQPSAISVASHDGAQNAVSGPVPAAYLMASANRIHFENEMISAQPESLDLAIADVIKIEAPVHLQDLAQRVASRWGHDQVRSRMMAVIKRRLEQLEQQRSLSTRGDFVYLPGAGAEVKVRSRLGTNIPAERISPEEYKEAVLFALAAGQSYDREELIKRVRGLFGFSRTGNQIRQQVSAAIDALLREDKIGEGSTGIRLRVQN
jgi:very-short-patch-repair endonuclease